jgi:hypothetical protein
MDKDKRKNHLKLVRSKKPKGAMGKTTLEELNIDSQKPPGSVDWQILTGPPDSIVIIDERAPLEVKLRVVAAVKSYTLGIKSVDHTLRKYGRSWEEQLSGEE